MATTKMTKAEKFALLRAIPAVAENEMLVEFIDHEVELLNRKNSSGEKKMTKNQIANEEIKARIYGNMESGKKYTVTDIQKNLPGFEDYTNQKLSALLRQMVPAMVTRTMEKGRPYFQKVEEDTEG